MNKEQIEKTAGETALREEFVKRGESLYQDKRILGALVCDYFATDKKLLKILRLAVQEGIGFRGRHVG